MALFPRDQGLLQRDLNFSFRFFNLNAVQCMFWDRICLEQNNLKISLAMYIRLEYSNHSVDDDTKLYKYRDVHIMCTPNYSADNHINNQDIINI